jgi:hypothetical protein
MKSKDEIFKGKTFEDLTKDIYDNQKNKKLQLAIRAKDREAAADRQATQDAGWAAHKDTLEDVKDMHQRDEENKKRLLYILIAVGILMTILILNV